MRRIDKLGKRAAALALAVSMSMSVMPSVLAVDAEDTAPAAAQTETQPADVETAEAKPVVVDPDQLPASSEPTEVVKPTDSSEEESASTDATDKNSEVDEYWNAVCAVNGHDWGSPYNVVSANCQHQSSYEHKCTRKYCGKTETVYGNDQKSHSFTNYTGTEATEEADGEKVAYCDYGCGTKDVKTIHYYGDWVVTKKAKCYETGEKERVCVNCGHVDKEEIPMIDHTWGTYVDDDKPGCEQQTATAHCTAEGCNATDTKNLPNFGSDGNPLPHKYTRWDTKIKWDGIIPKEITYADCDYGCGKHEERENNASLTSNTQAAKVAADETKGMVKDTINDALRATQAKVNQAQTKEEAIAALAEFEDAAAQALVDNVKLGGTKLLTKEQAKQLLKDAIPSMDSLQDSLNDSFLSKDSIQATVNTLVNSVTSEAGSKATEDAAYELIYNAAYDKLAGGSSDNTAAVKGLVTKLVTITADGSQEDWDALTDAIVDDAVKLAIEELRKDEDYAKLLDTKLGAETLEELEALIKQQLAEDPTFMNSVRNQIKTAGANATNGVTHGWSDQKVLDGLRRDLLPVSDLVENKIKELGDGAADIADKKVDDTVHKFLPGKLGDWISGKLSNKATDAVKKKVDEANKKATTTITDYIKQLTCGSKHNRETQEVILKYPTCTEPGQKGVECLNCGKIENKTEIPANGHTIVVDAAVAPTETSTGLTEGSHCSVCGAVLQAQETIPMLDPSIDTWFSRTATTEADAKAAGFDSVEAVNAALDAALVEAGFDPANAEHFTIQVNSSIGVLPNDRFPDDGVTGKLTLPEGTKGKMAQTYYAVQVFTANTRFHKAGDVLVTPVTVDNFSKTGLKFTVYTEAVMTIAWKAE